MVNYKTQLKELLNLVVKEVASDLHLSVGHPPTLRVSRRMIPLLKKKKLCSEDTKGLAQALMTDSQYKKFLEEKEIDFSYNFEQKARFRVNVFIQRGDISCALRHVSTKIRTIEELNLPPLLHKFAQASQGFVLITGPASHGKSTTLAALIDEINHERAEHIITI